MTPSAYHPTPGTEVPPPSTQAYRLHPDRRVLVLRDDQLPGGTKVRALGAFLDGAQPGDRFAYASPAEGHAQVALAIGCRARGLVPVVFTAARAKPHDRTREAIAAGALVEWVRPGYLAVVQARARAWCEATGATLLPFGFDDPAFHDRLVAVARAAVPHAVPEVWVAAGSGTLARALAVAFPEATLHAVVVGKEPDLPAHATVHRAPERFAEPASVPPPFPSASSYDAKVWRFVLRHAVDGALFWNVGR